MGNGVDQVGKQVPTIYVIDAHSLLYQIYHALPWMESPAHRPVHAIYGTIKDLLGFWHDFSPEYVVAAFDAKGKNFRHEMYREYKATRPPKPPELVEQMPLIRRVYDAFRIPAFCVDGVEADDTIATLARMARPSFLVQIVTIDKDARQLVGDGVKLLNLRVKHVMDTEGVFLKMGVTPSQVADYLAIVGDASDNIPGVPGIGEKGAVTLLQKLGNLEAILANPEQAPKPKQQKSLKDNAALRLSRQLVELKTDVPLAVDWEACKRQQPDMEALGAICRECGFNELWDEIEVTMRLVREPVEIEIPW